MLIVKIQIKGKKGETIVYSIPIQQQGDTLIIGDFRFWTPLGILEENGHKYFEIQGDSILVERDLDLDREIHVIYTAVDGLLAMGFFENEEITLPNFDMSGDDLITIKIPKNPAIEILVEVKEVLDA